MLPGGWRAFWGLAAVPVVAIPFVRARLAETERFTTARDSGRVAATRARDLFRGAYRRRAIGLLAVSVLKPVALTATSTWPYYHMVKTLGLSSATASLVYFVGGGIGLLGNPLGARLTDRWGRRPTSLLGVTLAVASGVAFYYVPPGSGALSPLPMLIALMAINQIATAIFSVADRCIDAELFPTALRATYLGAARLMNAAAGVFAMFGLSAARRTARQPRQRDRGAVGRHDDPGARDLPRGRARDARAHARARVARGRGGLTPVATSSPS